MTKRKLNNDIDLFLIREENNYDDDEDDCSDVASDCNDGDDLYDNDNGGIIWLQDHQKVNEHNNTNNNNEHVDNPQYDSMNINDTINEEIVIQHFLSAITSHDCCTNNNKEVLTMTSNPSSVLNTTGNNSNNHCCPTDVDETTTTSRTFVQLWTPNELLVPAWMTTDCT